VELIATHTHTHNQESFVVYNKESVTLRNCSLAWHPVLTHLCWRPSLLVRLDVIPAGSAMQREKNWSSLCNEEAKEI
jgi:hypothetical protein